MKTVYSRVFAAFLTILASAALPCKVNGAAQCSIVSLHGEIRITDDSLAQEELGMLRNDFKEYALVWSAGDPPDIYMVILEVYKLSM